MQRPTAVKQGDIAHGRAGSSSGITELSVNRQNGQTLPGEPAPSEEHAVLHKHITPHIQPAPPGLMQQVLEQCRRKLPTASGFVTICFASLLGYLTIARKCDDGCWPAACSALHFKSDKSWAAYRDLGSRDPTLCNEALAVPRVALMFMSSGRLHHEDSWRDWLADAGGLVPKEHIKEQGCTARSLKLLESSCGIRPEAPPLDRQFLFNVYTHPSAGYKGHPKSSVFNGREVASSRRSSSLRGPHSIVDAMQSLLTAALSSPHNSRFVFLSESDVPLYPAAVVWRQLQGETKSRINACPATPNDKGQVENDNFPSSVPKGSIMRHENWRKSSVRMGLQRKHAEMAVEETKYLEVMKKFCRSDKEGEVCFLDEHYIPSMLASKGVDEETDCHGGLVTADWSEPNAVRPRAYNAEDVKTDLFKKLRTDVLFGTKHKRQSCNADDAIKRGLASFARTDDLTPRSCKSERRWSKRSLVYECPLFARKFGNLTAKAVHNLLIDCEAGLQILDLGDGCD